MIIENTIDIEAPTDLVWAVTENLQQWPDWTPTCTSVIRLDDAPLAVGSAARIKQPGQPEALWIVTEYVPGNKFAWETTRFGFWIRAYHELTANELGTTNRLRVEMGGMVVRLLGMLLRNSVRKALAQENEGLKRHCEALSSRAYLGAG